MNPQQQLMKIQHLQVKNCLRKSMWDSASIVRNPKKIKETLAQVEKYLQQDVGRLLFLRLLTAKSILTSALNREKSLGAHYIKEN